MSEDVTTIRKIYWLLIIGGLIVAATFLVGLIWGVGTWESWWIANGLHFIGGAYAFFFVRAVFYYTKSYHKITAAPWAEILLFVIGALVLGVLWEWFEFVLDRYRVLIAGKESLMTYADNIGDLITDTLGAIVAGICALRIKPK